MPFKPKVHLGILEHFSESTFEIRTSDYVSFENAAAIAVDLPNKVYMDTITSSTPSTFFVHSCDIVLRKEKGKNKQKEAGFVKPVFKKKRKK